MAFYSVVYNDCHGGFSLSIDAVHWLAKYGCLGALRFIDEIIESGTANTQIIFCNEEMLGLNRHDSLLVMCVDELGEKASGSGSKILTRKLLAKQYRIRSYDGIETVEEPQTIKWITI